MGHRSLLEEAKSAGALALSGRLSHVHSMCKRGRADSGIDDAHDSPLTRTFSSAAPPPLLAQIEEPRDIHEVSEDFISGTGRAPARYSRRKGRSQALSNCWSVISRCFKFFSSCNVTARTQARRKASSSPISFLRSASSSSRAYLKRSQFSQHHTIREALFLFVWLIAPPTSIRDPDSPHPTLRDCIICNAPGSLPSFPDPSHPLSLAPERTCVSRQPEVRVPRIHFEIILGPSLRLARGVRHEGGKRLEVAAQHHAKASSASNSCEASLEDFLLVAQARNRSFRALGLRGLLRVFDGAKLTSFVRRLKIGSSSSRVIGPKKIIFGTLEEISERNEFSSEVNCNCAILYESLHSARKEDGNPLYRYVTMSNCIMIMSALLTSLSRLRLRTPLRCRPIVSQAPTGTYASEVLSEDEAILVRVVGHAAFLALVRRQLLSFSTFAKSGRLNSRFYALARHYSVPTRPHDHRQITITAPRQREAFEGCAAVPKITYLPTCAPGPGPPNYIRLAPGNLLDDEEEYHFYYFRLLSTPLDTPTLNAQSL
ncbi:hypothetical protein SCHPADRAFT_891849 [Schizopora paradoxa]|uniref:Uncharacterized protein n=1 Tax=Schizopora paradoxa TaxID=27342 RepID=A0A0H2RNU9_9AGAM|nr:hypothetical protein SCHPADRAFT_891849 [Schizopora paradoxa]